MKKFIFNLKQALPLMYYSHFKDANGNEQITIWRQWFKKILWSKHFNVIQP
ncbi:hypothetical protein [Acetobacterium woodii]|uniref:hypothetical protein n=1 Tax=Acetobacterium woodii TaxID=33952 RepID=UPI000317CB95|nr:hypothetical protein [Acetobacterium woodii]